MKKIIGLIVCLVSTSIYAQPVPTFYGGVNAMIGYFFHNAIGSNVDPALSPPLFPFRRIDDSRWQGGVSGHAGFYFPFTYKSGFLSEIEYVYLTSWRKNFSNVILYSGTPAVENTFTTNVSASGLFVNAGPTWGWNDNTMLFVKGGLGVSFNDADTRLVFSSGSFKSNASTSDFAWKVSVGAETRLVECNISLITSFDVISLGRVNYGTIQETSVLTAGNQLSSSHLFAYVLSFGVQSLTNKNLII